MSDTPRTDAAVWQIEGGEMVCPKFARHLERELNAANERIKRLEEALENISKELPAHDGSGGLFWPMFDGEGNEIGVQQVDPITVIWAMHARAMDALYGEDTKEDKP